MTTAVSTPPADTRRRNLLIAGVGGAAAIAGAGIAIWSAERRSQPDRADALWPLAFERPGGGELAMQSLRGKPLLLNFWATWCPPCVEEMPLLDSFFRQNTAKGWQVVGLAIDQPSSVRKFLERTPVSYPLGLAGLGGTELSKTLGNSSGGLPFTVVVDRGGAVLERRMGRIAPADLARWTAAA